MHRKLLAAFLIFTAIILGCSDNSSAERIREVLGIQKNQELTESLVSERVKALVPVETPEKFKGLLSDESTVFNCRPVADNKQYVASLHAGHKKGVISVRDRTQFPTSKSSAILRIPAVTVDRRMDVFLSNSFGFGGTNSSLVIKRFV